MYRLSRPCSGTSTSDPRAVLVAPSVVSGALGWVPFAGGLRVGCKRHDEASPSICQYPIFQSVIDRFNVVNDPGGYWT